MIHQTLNGTWSFRQTAQTQTFPAVVPGCVHTDLLANQLLVDPFFRDQEKEQKWVGETDWTYHRTFEVNAALLAHEQVLLKFHGLDTIATIHLNGQRLGETENMFRVYEFDVKPHLQLGENSIQVDFRSPMQFVREMDATLGEMAGWIEPMRVNSGAWIRKEPCNFGWDWGPKMPTVGIWREVELIAFSGARLQHVHILQDHQPSAVQLTLHVSAEVLQATPLAVNVVVRLNGETVAQSQADLQAEGNTTLQLILARPRLWWVNGLGEQPLYDVSVELLDPAHATLLDTLAKRIGLRVLQLETPNDEWGQAMYFTCNGVRFFAKGANWIPASPYPAEPTRDHLEVFVRATAQANMNMLRVWGGGIYEDEHFYDLCDEYGIAIWQDFMFACGTYPSTHAEWMANVAEEAVQNVRRIRHHASLAVWCGNNEIEQGMMIPAWEQTVSWDEYNLLFVDLLGQIVATHDPQRRYWQASPHSPGNVRDPFDQTVGDTHLWAVWHGKEPFEWYRTRQDRFCSEFGFQSFPEPATLNEFTAPEDRNITSYVMEYRQRSAIGNGTIIHYMLDWFRLPNTFESMVWLTQILQGLAMKYAVEHWRRNMPRTMGTLYWQLNDMWGAPSWASVDWRGRWKALHHMAKHFYTPHLISGVADAQSGKATLYVTSDLHSDEPSTAHWTLTDLEGRSLMSGEVGVTIQQNTNQTIAELDLRDVLLAHGERKLVLWFSLVMGGQVVSENVELFVRPKHVELLPPYIVTRTEQVAEGIYDVTLTVQAVALYVWLELPDAHLSDNFFHLRPDVPKVVRITSATLTGLGVHSLRQTYTA